MTTKHTPGPWRAIDRKNDRGAVCGITIVASQPEPEYGDMTTTVVCRLPDGSGIFGHAFPHQPANARLIAAAPALLAACERLGKLRSGPTRSGRAEWVDHVLELAEDARAAIDAAKVTA